MNRKKTKNKQREDNSELNLLLERFAAMEESKYISINGIRFVSSTDNIPEKEKEYPSQRSLFLAEEGSILCMLLETNLTFEEFQCLWDEFHRIVFSIDGNDVVTNVEYNIRRGEQEDLIILSADIDLAMFWKAKKQRIGISVSVGKRNISSELKKDIWIVPERYFPEIYTSDFYFLPEDSFSAMSQGAFQTGFNREEEPVMVICYACRCVSSSTMTVGAKEVEVEFRLVDDKGELMESCVTRMTKDETNDICVASQEIFIGSYVEGEYKVEAYIFNDKIAEANFSIGKTIKGKPRFREMRTLRAVHEVEKDSIDRINELIGLHCVKRDLRMKMNYMKLMAARKKAGLPVTERLMHTVMVGNPGTGKTTVARLMASALHEIGILSKGHLVECNRENLTDSYIGGSEKRTREMIDMAKGGVMFIDEAYSLFEEGPMSKDFGRKVIDTLMPILSDSNSDLVVILAGYGKEMEQLLTSNPGLSSRFPVRLKFEDYSVDELMAIAELFFNKNCYRVDSYVMAKIREILSVVKPIHNFGNGRFVHTLIENFILPAMGERLAKLLDEGILNSDILSTIYKEDIPTAHEVLDMMGLKQRESRVGFR